MPVLIFDLPDPSMFSLSWILVSAVLRFCEAVLMLLGYADSELLV